ncbi:VWA domain-containing protein [Limibacillus sp. MBR-115]|uniref:VWA domain-containing protein n=1 Tax=Limibacillus sp. MBR-115 TaxID=3156465 RepID=UPI0033997CF3
MSQDRKLPSETASKTEVADFLSKVSSLAVSQPDQGNRGRLIFALDATASRQPTWDRAMDLQAEMFNQTASLGGLEVQLAYYRGFGEFRVSKWHPDGHGLLRAMTGVSCFAGRTQIRKVLKHALKETRKQKVGALVFVGDSMEEDLDTLGELAGKLGLVGIPCFIFHEGGDVSVRQAFEQIARLSGGACCSFDASSARQLRDLLSAVAVYAAGGRRALQDFSKRQGGVVRLLTHQMR